MARLLIQNSFPMLAASPQACSSRSLAAPALPPPAPPSHWRRDKIPPTPSALSAASSKRKSLSTRNKEPKIKTEKLKTANSLVAERDHRIDARRAWSGDITCAERDARQQKQNPAKGGRIERAHDEKLAGQNTSESQRNKQARQQAKTRSEHSIARDEFQDIASLRAQCHTDTNFAGALRNHVGHHTVNPDGGEKERESSKGGKQCHGEPPLRK